MMNYNYQPSLTQIKEEFDEITNSTVPDFYYGVSIGLVNRNYFEWQIAIVPPFDSPFKGGLFILRINFPPNYPQNPPIARFLTPIYHMNVNPFFPKRQCDYPLGFINISILKYWNPLTRIKEVIGDIYALFYLENPDFCLGLLESYNEMRNNEALHIEKIKHFSKKYADPSRVDRESDERYNRDWDFNLY